METGQDSTMKIAKIKNSTNNHRSLIFPVQKITLKFDQIPLEYCIIYFRKCPFSCLFTLSEVLKFVHISNLSHFHGKGINASELKARFDSINYLNEGVAILKTGQDQLNCLND